MAFNPSDLDYKHVGNIIARAVQSSLTPRIDSGRGGAALLTKFINGRFKDSIPWMTYSLEVKGFYPGKVPKTALALIFPKGAKAREALITKTRIVRSYLEWAAPKIYGTSLEQDPKSYNVVVMEDLEGEPLNDVWPRLNDEQKKAVLEKVADILAGTINIRPTKDIQASPTPADPNDQAASSSSVTLYDTEKKTRSQVSTTNLEHLRKAYTILYSGLFHSDGEPNPDAFRKRFVEYHTYELSPQDIVRVKSLNEMLSDYMIDFSGGNFLPPHISGADRDFKDSKERNKFRERELIVRTILSESNFRMRHKSMQMSSFVVNMDGDEVKSLALTQWEKSFFAPLWASSQLPPWLESFDPEQEDLVMPAEEMTKWREYMVYHLMLKKERLPRGWLWFVAYVYGELERHFEMILTTTWVWNARMEPLLKQVMEHAARKRTTAYKKRSGGFSSDPFVPLVGIHTMEVNFSELMGKWMPFARRFVAEEGFLDLQS